ncbi:MAG: hypothetical protein ACTSUE_09450 [Promethearchaeota archaeon]
MNPTNNLKEKEQEPSNEPEKKTLKITGAPALKGEKKERAKEDKGIHALLSTFLIAFTGLITYMLLYFTVFTGSFNADICGMIPGNVLVDLSAIFVIPLILSAVLTIPAMSMARFFIRLAKLMKLKKFDIGIQSFKVSRIITTRKAFARGLVAMLFALAISLSINNMVFDLGFQIITDSKAYSIAALSSLLMPLAVTIMVPTWFLKDAGIIFFKPINQRKKKPSKLSREPYDIASVGTYYDYVFKGFLGITTPFMYAYAFLSGDEISTEPVLSLVVTIGPLLMIGVASIPTWIYIKNFPKHEAKFLKRVNFKRIEMKFTFS